MNYGTGNKIQPFKERLINLDKPVEVYRNLNRKGRVYSIRQNGLVVGHAQRLMLRDVTFHVSKSGVDRVRQNKRKNVHAWASGLIALNGGMGTDATVLDERNKTLSAKITYNPYQNYNFMNGETPVNGGKVIVLNQMGMSGAYLH